VKKEKGRKGRRKEGRLRMRRGKRRRKEEEEEEERK
jgi:hypothetical protein